MQNTGILDSAQSQMPEVKPDDEVVDFYRLLGEPRDATTIQLRSRINEAYAEAQANRDHRSPIKRREYANLLSWLPACRNVLLHEAKRAKYDDFIAQTPIGATDSGFSAFLTDLTGDLDLGSGESILGIKPNSAAPVAAEASSPDVPAFVARRNAEKQEAERQTAVAGTSEKSPSVMRRAASSASPEGAALAHRIQETGAPTMAPAVKPAPKVRATKQPLHPELQRERAYLLSSAAGFVLGFAILLITRAALHTPLFFSSVLAAIAGSAVWFSLRRTMLGAVRES